MLKSCKYCGRIHDSKFDCGKKPNKYRKLKAEERIRCTSKMKRKSEEIKKRANYLCEYCLSQNKLTYTQLETHHIYKLTERADLALSDTNLICLCRSCHEKAEKGLISAHFLIKLAQNREKNTPRSFNYYL